MQDEIKTAQNRIDRLNQELEAVIEAAAKAENMARNKLNEAHETLRTLLIEADSHLPQADRVWYGPDGKDVMHGRVVIEKMADDGVLTFLTVRFAGIPDGPRMQFWKMGNVWKERGAKMVLRNVPDIAEILKGQA